MYITASITKENIANFMSTLKPESLAIFEDYFRDLHSKEVLESFPLPAVADGERVHLNEFLEAGCYDY